MTTTVLVAGATGNLGSRIVAEVVERGADVRALVRPSRADGGDSLRPLAEAGRIRLAVGDLADDPDALARHLDGVDVVVSAVQGGKDVVVDGQIHLLRAAELAGVGRMIPSDFSLDLHRLDFGDNLFLDLRKTADAAFAESPVRPTSVLVGGFMEAMLSPWIGILDREHDRFAFWGDGEQPIDLTAIPDAAAFTAAVALDASTADRIVSFAGDVLTMRQLHAAAERALGRPLQVVELGSVADLADEIERRRATATSPFDYVPLQYQWAMVSGKGKLRNLRNADHPEIAPTSAERFLGGA